MIKSQILKEFQTIPGILLCIVTLLVGFCSLKPSLIINQRSERNQLRNNKIKNSIVYKNILENVTKDYVILNCRPYENIELMFYNDVLAYHWYPPENILDSLQSKGYKFAAFEYNNDQQQLPGYIIGDKEILIINEVVK